ncbi:retrotransposon protein, putative, ty1-copia subclass [Tanacetum coccineum]
MNKSCTTWKRPLLSALPATATAAVHNAYTRKVAEQQEVACLMLRAEQELFETVKAFHAYKQEEGQSVSTYVLKMKAYLDQIKCLGYPMPLTGHWKRNYPLYLAELKKNKASASGTSVVEAIGSFELIIPSGMILVLDNCHFPLLLLEGLFQFHVYGTKQQENHAQLGFYFSMALSSWHINKKRIEKLQHDGLLKSINDESFDVCVSCISGKMARKPFTHASERADDLLGIIHSDVCGPFRTTSREGANYYVTFTDDFSRYGYVYLIKHKHEVFEMFKAFQNEVENQLEKTIKALRSDRGREYLSQQILDHLRSHGIISQLTPPYTPQHNGVSKKRNRTLLDMVRSMMSLTTLPMSFWGYALESTARILNTIPTKKVNKTPYEIWHGKVPNLSYLKV